MAGLIRCGISNTKRLAGHYYDTYDAYMAKREELDMKLKESTGYWNGESGDAARLLIHTLLYEGEYDAYMRSMYTIADELEILLLAAEQLRELRISVIGRISNAQMPPDEADHLYADTESLKKLADTLRTVSSGMWNIYDESQEIMRMGNEVDLSDIVEQLENSKEKIRELENVAEDIDEYSNGMIALDRRIGGAFQAGAELLRPYSRDRKLGAKKKPVKGTVTVPEDDVYETSDLEKMLRDEKTGKWTDSEIEAIIEETRKEWKCSLGLAAGSEIIIEKTAYMYWCEERYLELYPQYRVMDQYLLSIGVNNEGKRNEIVDYLRENKYGTLQKLAVLNKYNGMNVPQAAEVLIDSYVDYYIHNNKTEIRMEDLDGLRFTDYSGTIESSSLLSNSQKEVFVQCWNEFNTWEKTKNLSIIGMMACIYAECSYNEQNYEGGSDRSQMWDDGSGIGICQWTLKVRKEEFLNYAIQEGYKFDGYTLPNLEIQLGYLKEESCTDPESMGTMINWNKFNECTTPEATALYFAHKYEISDKIYDERREVFAREIYNWYVNRIVIGREE